MTYSTYGLGNQTSYTQNADLALPGLVRQRTKLDTVINGASDTRQEVAIDVGTAANTTAYTVTVGNITQTYTSDGTATATEIRDGLIAALKASTIINSKFTVEVVDADTLKLVHRLWGVNELVSVGGGGAGYAATNTAAVSSAMIPYGLVAAAKTGYGMADGVPVAGLPSAAGDTILGIFASTKTVPLAMPTQTEAAYRRGDRMGVLSQGVIWAVAEVAITFTDSLFFRHTASGGLTQLGALSNASGTGKSALARVRPDGPSFIRSDGSILVPVAVNLP
jgi:hypothetical protein